MKLLHLRAGYLLIPGLTFLLLALVTLLVNPTVAANPAATELVSGTYAGGVTVSAPAPLGALELRLDITSVDGALSGQVNPIKTQVFLGGPTFTGQVTVTTGLTPTLRIASEVFSGIVSGRTVQRHFLLTGEVLDEGNGLRGEYTETILGFTAQPMLIKGTFLLLRPDGLQRIVTVPAPDGSTPTSTPTQPGPGGPSTATPTATATVPSGPGNPGSQNNRLYLPLVSKNGRTVSGAAVGEVVNAGSEAVTATATPTPTVTPTVVAATESGQQTYLPWVGR